MHDNIPEHLIVRYLSGEASPEEERQLFQWIDQREHHQKIFTQWREAWNEASAPDNTFRLQEGLSRLNAHIDQLDEQESNNRSFSFRMGVAAAISIFVMALLSVYFYGRSSKVEGLLTTLTERTTGAGERVTIRLQDGSTVKVNSNSILKYPENFNGIRREVYLEGEAFFEIAKDSLRPFIVHTGEVSTAVLGTSFNIRALEKQVSVSVATGKVEVTHAGKEEVLVPYEKVVWERSTQQFRKSTTDLEYDLAWLSNTILFEDTSLEDAVVTLERWYGVSIAFENNAVKKCSITGTFKNENIQTVLRAIELSTGVHFRITGKSVALYGEGCP